MPEGNVLVSVDTRGVATITLNRPEVHNAFDDETIERLTREFRTLGDDEDVRVVLLTARGKTFCAGADLNWMKRSAEFSEAENLNDASSLSELLQVLDALPQPTVALIQGPAYAGGGGLICACDIAIAARHARFSLTEVRLGLLPAVISPFVINTIGDSYARRYFLTGESIDSADAERIGLVHEVVPDEALTVRGDTLRAVAASLIFVKAPSGTFNCRPCSIFANSTAIMPRWLSVRCRRWRLGASDSMSAPRCEPV